jgi:glycosyltransferase involved in cell wall biosynthesis
VNDRPRRVLYLNHGAKPSGAEFALLRLLGAIDRTRVTPIMLFGEEGPMVQRMRDIGVETHVLPLTDKVKEIRKDTLHLQALLAFGKLALVGAYAAKIALFARRNRIDVIHTNTIKAHVYGALAARMAGLPLVWHIRDFVNDSYFPAPAVRVFRSLARWLPSHVICVSKSVMEQLHLNDGGKKSTVILDGLSEQELAPIEVESARPTGAPLKIGIVGRIAEWKGQHVFLEAAAQVTKAGGDAEYVIVGAPLFGEEEYEAGLHKQAEEAGISSRVHFLGFKKDVAAVMRGLDIVVHASITGEPFGQVITEGMAAGKPVIATRGGGVPEIITHDATGLLTSMGDAGALAAEISSLLKDPAKLQRLADAGYAHVRRNFTAGAGARVVEQIYGRLGAKRSPSGSYSPSQVARYGNA